MMSQPLGQFPLSDLPDDILGEILVRLSGPDLVGSCVCVCKRWRDVVNSQTLWKEKCKQDYYYTDEMFKNVEDFKNLYFKNPYNSNLVKNPCAQEGFTDWTITRNGGDQFIHESEPAGCHPVKNFAKCDDITGPIGCWTTSFNKCEKEQVIDLVERGGSPEILDKVRPDIAVSEWYAARFDCGCHYKISIKLLDKDKNVLDRYQFTDQKDPGRDWFQFTHVFTSYPPGCRFIKYSHGGKDNRFWAGHYGVKMTLSSVKFDFWHVAGPYEGVFQLSEQKQGESDSDEYDGFSSDEDVIYTDSDDYDDDNLNIVVVHGYDGDGDQGNDEDDQGHDDGNVD